MITVQELLNQKSLKQSQSAEQAERAEQPDLQTSSQKPSQKKSFDQKQLLRSFAQRRHGLNQRQLLGLTSLGLGYVCLGWTLQVATTPVFVWLGLWAAAGIWGLRRSRNWHSLLPALISAFALVSVMLPTWVMGLLLLPIATFFGCVLLMKEQTLLTALLSSIAVYGLTLTAASLGAIALAMTGTQSLEILQHLARISTAFILLSLFPVLHRRRQTPYPATQPGRSNVEHRPKTLWRRGLAKIGLSQGRFIGIALAGLTAGAWLSRTDWVGVTALIR